MVDSKVVKLDKYHKIVHLTFGTNPFIKNNIFQISDYERSQDYLCIGVEDTNNNHIDICLNAKPINNLSLITFWIKQKLRQLIN